MSGMSGSEVETYISDAQVWPRETIGKKEKNPKSPKDFFFLENNSSYLAQMSTLRCVYLSQLTV